MELHFKNTQHNVEYYLSEHFCCLITFRPVIKTILGALYAAAQQKLNAFIFVVIVQIITVSTKLLLCRNK